MGYARPQGQRQDWGGIARFAGCVSDYNIAGRETHWSVLRVSEGDFGDNRSVIWVADERMVQQLRIALVTLYLNLYSARIHCIVTSRASW